MLLYQILAFKTSKRVIQKTEETTGYLIGKKIAHRTTKITRSSPQNKR